MIYWCWMVRCISIKIHPKKRNCQLAGFYYILFLFAWAMKSMSSLYLPHNSLMLKNRSKHVDQPINYEYYTFKKSQKNCFNCLEVTFNILISSPCHLIWTQSCVNIEHVKLRIFHDSINLMSFFIQFFKFLGFLNINFV